MYVWRSFSFSLQSNISLWGYVTTGSYICQLINILAASFGYDNFFVGGRRPAPCSMWAHSSWPGMEPIPSSVEVWSLDYWIAIWLWWIIPIWIFTYKSLCGHMLSFFFFLVRLGGNSGSYGSLCNFKILLTLFQQDCTIYILTRKDMGSSFFMAFPTLDIVDLSNFTHFSNCVVASHCGFTVHLPKKMMLNMFLHTYWSLIHLLSWSVIQKVWLFL